MVVAIMAILVAIALPAYPMAIKHANCTGCVSRMRTLGIAFTLYANDNNGHFPGRVTTTGNDRWPALLLSYVGDPKNYVDPGDPVANAVPTTNLVSNTANNSSFFFNGFSDLGAYTNQNFQVGMVNVTDASNLILLGQKVNGNTQYYMDFVEGNQDDILNKKAYFGGANYTFADGSSRFMTQAYYDTPTSPPVGSPTTDSQGDYMWLLNKNYSITVPAGH